MNDRQDSYLPRCRICGPLGAPCGLRQAEQVIGLHRQRFHGHDAYWLKTPNTIHITIGAQSS